MQEEELSSGHKAFPTSSGPKGERSTQYGTSPLPNLSNETIDEMNAAAKKEAERITTEINEDQEKVVDDQIKRAEQKAKELDPNYKSGAEKILSDLKETLFNFFADPVQKVQTGIAKIDGYTSVSNDQSPSK